MSERIDGTIASNPRTGKRTRLCLKCTPDFCGEEMVGDPPAKSITVDTHLKCDVCGEFVGSGEPYRANEGTIRVYRMAFRQSPDY